MGYYDPVTGTWIPDPASYQPPPPSASSPASWAGPTSGGYVSPVTGAFVASPPTIGADDPDNFYGNGYGGGNGGVSPSPLPANGGPTVAPAVIPAVYTPPVPSPAPGPPPITSGTATVSIAYLVWRLGRLTAWLVVRAIRAAGGLYSRLPGWVRKLLEVVGVVAAYEIVLDGDDPEPPWEDPAMGPFGAGVVPVSAWEANGVQFYRLSDGRLAVQNKDGVWRIWTPKKPIVIMPTGAGDLRTLLRADGILNRQSKRLDKMLRRRVGRRAKGEKGARAPVIVETGPGSVVTK